MPTQQAPPHIGQRRGNYYVFPAIRLGFVMGVDVTVAQKAEGANAVISEIWLEMVR